MISRPARGECADYYFVYIDAVPDGDVLEHLVQSHAELRQMVQPLTDAQARTRYDDGKWSIKELLVHLLDSERTFGFRTVSIVRQDPAALPDFDQDPWVAASQADERPLEDILEEFDLVRRGHLALFRSIRDEWWDRRGRAAGLDFTVRCFPWILAGHEIHHRRVLAERYLPQLSR